MPNSPFIGAHFSIAGGRHKAIIKAHDSGCNTVQIFTKSPNNWAEPEISEQQADEFKTSVAESRIRTSHIFSHTAYLINLASPTPELSQKSKTSLASEISRCSLLNIPYIVFHPGAHMGDGVDTGIRRITESLNQVLNQAEGGPNLLIETTAGQGTTLGSRFEEIARIIDGVEQKNRMGFCVDTAHIFAAGYDFRDEPGYQSTMGLIDKIIGLHKLKLIHVNDSKTDLGSCVDRHHHIGFGKIGETGFKQLMADQRLAHIPKILETPKTEENIDWDRKNLSRLYRWAGSRLPEPQS